MSIVARPSVPVECRHGNLRAYYTVVFVNRMPGSDPQESPCDFREQITLIAPSPAEAAIKARKRVLELAEKGQIRGVSEVTKVDAEPGKCFDFNLGGRIVVPGNR